MARVVVLKDFPTEAKRDRIFQDLFLMSSTIHNHKEFAQKQVVLQMSEYLFTEVSMLKIEDDDRFPGKLLQRVVGCCVF